jgi:hypothetical protein
MQIARAVLFFIVIAIAIFIDKENSDEFIKKNRDKNYL